ncbi:MAG: HEAT repeat domain-containing protein [Steroidobacteraceae bacterium]
MSDTSSPLRGIPSALRSTPSPLYLVELAAEDSAAAPAPLVDRFRNLHEGPLVFHEVVRLGDAAVPALENLIRGPSDAVHQPRCLAADALAAIGSSAAVHALAQALLDSVARDPSPTLLEAESILVNHIAEHLSRFPRPEVTEALLSALRRRRYPYCAAALGLTGDPRAIPLLVQCLYEDPARPAAAAALRRFGQETLEPLAHALLEAPSGGTLEPPSRIDGRVAAARLLGDFARVDSRGTPFAIAPLVKALSDSQRAVRVEAALGLVGCGARADEDIVRILVAALEEESWARAEEIITVLVRLGSTAEHLLIPIIGLRPRDEADRRRRVRAVEAVGRLGSVAAVSVLRRLCTSSDTTLRFATVRALASIGSSDASSLALFLDDPHPSIRFRALQALVRRWALEPEVAIRLLGDEDPHVRSLAASAVRDNIAAALPSLKRAASHCGAPVEGLAPRLRLWWHACALIVEAGRGTRCG